MKKLTILLTSLLFILFVNTATFAQLNSQKIDSLMDDALIKFKVAGASIAIVPVAQANQIYIKYLQKRTEIINFMVCKEKKIIRKSYSHTFS